MGRGTLTCLGASLRRPRRQPVPFPAAAPAFSTTPPCLHVRSKVQAASREGGGGATQRECVRENVCVCVCVCVRECVGESESESEREGERLGWQRVRVWCSREKKNKNQASPRLQPAVSRTWTLTIRILHRKPTSLHAPVMLPALCAAATLPKPL